MPDGLFTVVARAFPSKIPATASRSTVVDLTPPSITINPPADVVVPAPPFIAAITGTAADNASGVAAVEWQFGGGAINAAAGTTNWLAQVPLPGLGVHTVAVRARDNIGNVGPMQTVTVRVGDITPPALGIAVPAEGEARSLVDGKATFDLRGTASDTQSGVALVEWSLDGQTTFTPATPQAGNDWSTWSAQVPVTVAGNHTITVRATDKAAPGNATPLQRGVIVAEPFQPKDPDAVFSPTAYLDDLLDFATHRARTATGGSLISRQLLVDSYLQPFTDLVTSDNRSVANQSASQVRLCIDVLRRYLAAHGGTVPADAEAAYRQAVYVAVLRQLGTSFDEMRLSRMADDAARGALADRLGIALARFRPDRLDELLFQSADLTEAALKVFFGLEETTVKPLTGSLLPEPNLLIWQKEHLRVGWLQQDNDARSELDAPVPVIDPDMLGTEDLRTPSPGNAAFDLWKARQDDLAAYLTALDAARKPQKTQLAGFDKIAAALGPVAELLAMAEERKLGHAIDAQLRAKRLTIQAFLHLMRVRRLAAAGTVLDAEWADVYAILVQVRKLGRAAPWRVEEQKKGLVLGPDFFRLTDPVGSPAPTLPAWRATPQARQAWRRTLESRIQQELTLTQAMQSVVSAAEEEALPLLRQACLAAIAGDRDPAVIADRLTQELGIDCLASGRQRTTRAQQGLETLQVVLLSLRTGRLKTEPPVLGTVNPAAAWVLALDPAKPYAEKDFDEEWLWMGGYGTWNAAIRVFAYPEIYLLPELRPVTVPPAPPRPIDQTNAYQQLMTDLRNQPRLTPAAARALAARYHQTLASNLGTVLPASLRPGALTITEQVTDSQLAARRTFIRDTLFAGITDPSKAPNYVQEIFFFVPLALALQLQRSGQYLVALDWIETFYTDHLAAGERKIYHGLVLEEKITTQYQRNPDNWLRVGLNPHEIVGVRASAYTRFTLITLARCYLDFADAEFTRDDGDAVARARSLYGTALALLGLPEMQ
ncbi:MAG TPA: Ig-like domain-containing protein, partial [Nakamurella sp.]